MVELVEGLLTKSRLYNHVRTVAFWLDSAPVLADLGLPFRVSVLDTVRESES